MQHFIHGVDRAGVAQQLDDLAEAHWSYLDGFAESLVARGPTLTPDGTGHTGSIHILETAGPEAARRFAGDEPYAGAGLYATVSVDRFHNAVGGTMWDRRLVRPDAVSALALLRWPPRAPVSAGLTAEWQTLTTPADQPAMATRHRAGALVFGGLLLDDTGAQVEGLVLAMDEPPATVERRVRGYLAARGATEVTVSRWQRGGRPTG